MNLGNKNSRVIVTAIGIPLKAEDATEEDTISQFGKRPSLSNSRGFRR
jgi:hypothetical protein